MSNVKGCLGRNSTFFTAPHTFQWTPNSQHTIVTTSPQTNGGTQYVWLNWSDSGTISHTIATPAAPTTYTATFKTQYLLTTQVNLAAGGAISRDRASWTPVR
jgi:hypothetical protein